MRSRRSPLLIRRSPCSSWQRSTGGKEDQNCHQSRKSFDYSSINLRRRHTKDHDKKGHMSEKILFSKMNLQIFNAQKEDEKYEKP